MNNHVNSLEDESYEFLFENATQRAIAYFEDIYRHAESEEKRMEALKFYVFHLISACEYKKVKQLCEEHLEAYRNTHISSIRSNLGYCLAIDHYYRGYFLKALDFLNESQSKGISDLSDYHRGLSHLLFGRIHLKLGNFFRAILYFLYAIHFFVQHDGESLFYVKAFNLIGLSYTELGKFDYAAVFFKETKDTLEDLLDAKAHQHHWMGALYCDQGSMCLKKAEVLKENNLTEANQLLEQAKELFVRANHIFDKIYSENLNNRYTSVVNKNLGLYYLKMAKYRANIQYLDAAKKYIDIDINIRKEHLFKYQKNKSGNHPTIARGYRYLGDYHLQSFADTQKKESLYQVVYAAQNALYAVIRNYDSEELGRNNLVYINNIDNPNFLAEVDAPYSVLSALAYKIKALTILKEETEHTYNTIREALKIIELLHGDHLPKTKSSTLKLGQAIKNTSEVILAFLSSQYKTESSEKQLEICDLVFRVMMYSKNFTTIQELEMAGDQFIEVENLVEEITHDIINNQKSDIYSIIESKRSSIKDLMLALNEEHGMDNMETISIYEEAQRNNVSVFTEAQNKIRAIGEKNNNLPSAIFSFFWGQEEVYLLYFCGQKHYFKKLGIAQKMLKEHIKNFTDILNRNRLVPSVKPNTRDVINEIFEAFEACKQLSKAIFEDISIHDTVKYLIFIPDGDLEFLPFSNLRSTSNPDFEYSQQYNNSNAGSLHYHLIQDYYISYHLSLYLLYKEIGIGSGYIQQNNNHPIIAIGSDFQHDNRGYYITEGVVKISKLFPPESIKVFQEKNSNHESFTAPNITYLDKKSIQELHESIEQTSILYIAHHHQRQRGLIELGEGIILDENSIKAIKYNDLVYLAGCSTGIGDIDEGGSLSLGRIFLKNRNIRNVIINLTDTYSFAKEDDDNFENSLVFHFFEELKKAKSGISFAVALGRAKRKVLAKNRGAFRDVYIAAPAYYGNPMAFYTPIPNSYDPNASLINSIEVDIVNLDHALLPADSKQVIDFLLSKINKNLQPTFKEEKPIKIRVVVEIRGHALDEIKKEFEIKNLNSSAIDKIHQIVYRDEKNKSTVVYPVKERSEVKFSALKKELKRLVSQNKFSSIIEKLYSIISTSKTESQESLNSLRLIEGRYNKYRYDSTAGTKKDTELDVEFNKIRNILLGLITELNIEETDIERL